MSERLFLAAYPYGSDVLALPVSDTREAAEYYSRGFGLAEVERKEDPATVVMERDGVRIGFCENGGDPSQEGAAIEVSDIHRAREELLERGVSVANWRVDERDGERVSGVLRGGPGWPLLLLPSADRLVSRLKSVWPWEFSHS